MNELRVKLPSRLVKQLRDQNVSAGKMHVAVLAALWRLVNEPSSPPQLPNEAFSDYVVRASKEMGDGASLVGKMTWQEWNALSDAEQEALWNKWHAEAEADLDEIGWTTHAVIKNTARQKHRAKIPSGVREKGAEYRTRRKRTTRR